MKVELTDKAKRQLKKLPAEQQRKVIRKLRLLEDFPLSGKALSGDFSGSYSFRAWPYRIIYVIDKKSKLVEVITVEHRQRAYKG